MAVTLISRPDGFSSAYVPVEYTFTSDIAPPSGNYVQTIVSVEKVTENIATNHGFDIDAVAVLIVAPFPDVKVGQFLEILNTNKGLYNGVFRIERISNQTDALFQIEGPFVGNDDGGTGGRFLKDYSVVVDLFINDTFTTRLRAQHDQNSNFVFDISEELQAFIGSDLLTYGATGIAASTDVCKNFFVQYTEEFAELNTVTNIDEVELKTPFTDDSENTLIAVNAVVPYVEARNNVIKSTAIDLSDFTITESSVGKRFLTNQPSSIKIGEADHYQLLASILGSDDTNLFTDGDDGTFEADIVGMVSGSLVGALSQDCTISHEGSCSCKGTVSVAGTSFGNYFRHSTNITLEAGKTYSVKCRFAVKQPFSSTSGNARITTDSAFDYVGATVSTVKDWSSLNSAQQDAATFYELETHITPAADLIGRFVVFGQANTEFNAKDVVIDQWTVTQLNATFSRRVETFDNLGASIAVTDTVFTALERSCINIPVGTQNLGATITAATVKYEVSIINDSSVVVSEVLTFEVDRKCHKSALRFYWVSQRSGMDAYTFIGNSNRSVDIRQPKFKRRLASPRVLPERQTTTIINDSQGMQTGNSGLVSREIAEWLEDFLRSAERYIQMDNDVTGTPEFIPIDIENGSFDINNTIKQTSNISFQWSIAVDEKSQKN